MASTGQIFNPIGTSLTCNKAKEQLSLLRPNLYSNPILSLSFFPVIRSGNFPWLGRPWTWAGVGKYCISASSLVKHDAVISVYNERMWCWIGTFQFEFCNFFVRKKCGKFLALHEVDCYRHFTRPKGLV